MAREEAVVMERWQLGGPAYLPLITHEFVQRNGQHMHYDGLLNKNYSIWRIRIKKVEILTLHAGRCQLRRHKSIQT